jgi:hypothetical protein
MGANAVTTVPVYTAGEVLTAADMNITNSGIPVFATTVTRDAAFGGTGEKTLAEGQFAYIEATDQTQYYSGSSWQSLGAVALIETLTPSAAATAQFTTGSFSSAYKFYTVKYVLNNPFGFQLRSAGTTITAANYTRAIAQNSTGNVYSGGYSTGSTSFAIMNSTADPRAYEGSFDCFDASTSRVQSFSPMNSFGVYSGATQATSFGLYLYASAQVYDSLLFTPISGTLTGTIKLYGWS